MARLWRFDTTIDTDVLAPGFYMKKPLEELARHCLEAVRPEFAASVRPVRCDVPMPYGVGSSRDKPLKFEIFGDSCDYCPQFCGYFLSKCD